jgi:hypothetical protein
VADIKSERWPASRWNGWPASVGIRKTMICDSCNTAEGEAKKALGLPSHFSFAPTEIARFVVRRPNAMNEVDVEKARQVWLGIEAEIESRLAFADVLVERLASGLFTMERGGNAKPVTHSPLDEFLRREAISQRPVRELKEWGSRFWGELSQRSVCREGMSKSGKLRRPARVRPPTDAEFAAFEGRRDKGKGWERTGADWTCPCCGRGKRAILRLSGSRNWFTQIRTIPTLDFETDAGNLAFRHALYPDHLESPVVADRRERYICADCRDVASELQRARPDLERPLLTLADIRDCLGEIRDNEKAEIDLVLAAKRSEANDDLRRADWEFSVHKDLSLHLWEVFQRFGQRATKASHAALLGVARAFGIEPETAPGGLRWLLEQGEAFERTQRRPPE